MTLTPLLQTIISLDWLRVEFTKHHHLSISEPLTKLMWSQGLHGNAYTMALRFCHQ